MRKIEINEDNIIKKFSHGIESNIYVYNDPKYYDRTVLYKKLKTKEEREKEFNEYKKKNAIPDSYFMSIEDISPYLLDDKLKKLIIMSNMDCLNDEIKIYDLVYKDNIFQGYTMEKCNYNIIDCYTRKKYLLKYLKIIRDKIEILNNNGIYIGDFNYYNFLVNKKFSKVKLCDLDNFKVGSYDFDVKTIYMQKFEKNCSNINYIDSYSFNFFTLSMLAKYNLGDFEVWIDKIRLPFIINTKENRNILNSMNYLDDTYEYKFLIDNLR